MTGFHGKIALAALSLLALPWSCMISADLFAAPVKQESREASFVPPTTDEAPLALIYQSLSSPVAGDSTTPAAPPSSVPPATPGSASATSSPPAQPSAAASEASPAAHAQPAKPPVVSVPSIAPPAPSPGASAAAAVHNGEGSSAKAEALKLEQKIESPAAAPEPGVPAQGAPVAPPKDSKASAPVPQAAAVAIPTTYPPAPSHAALLDTASPLALAPVDPNAFGLLLPEEDGMGADMWKGTAYATVERLLPSLDLPSSSPALNHLAYRLLASSALPPEGESLNERQGLSLTSLRIDRLIALGRPVEAWRLATLAKTSQIDKTALRMAAEAALASGDQTSVAEACVRAPDLFKQTSDTDWQKILIVCHLRANDTKAAQLGLDVMAAQNPKDELFLSLASKNVLEGSKQLPRRLTPLAPLPLALIRLTSLPLRNELYARPAAALIPEVLKAKTENVNARLALAERAAAQGLINATFLGTVYADVDFSNLPLAARETDANKIRETGPMLRARLYQIAMEDKSPDNRLNAALRLIQSVSPAEQGGGAMRNLALAMLKDLAPATASSLMTGSPAAALMVSLLADDKPEQTLGWLKIARDEASRTPSVAKALTGLWPLIALGGFEPDKDFAENLHVWLKHTLKAGSSGDAAIPDSTAAAQQRVEAALRERRKIASTVLLTLNAAGFAIPDDAWAQVMNAPDAFEKTPLPPALLMERLRESGRLKRKGETVLEALAVAGDASAVPLSVRLDIIRALRNSGFVREALAFAQETLLATQSVSAGGSGGVDSR